MSEKYDVVVYGATGVTGAKIFETLVKCGKFDGFSVGIAGRSDQKLRKVIENVEKTTGRCLQSVGILICDATNFESMVEMAKRAKLVINAVGPFRLHGEVVVRACVENGAHQIDVAGEPEWIERMEAKFGGVARENGVYVVSACGWDSIPADFGVHLLKKHFDGQLSRIEAFVEIHYGPSGYSFSATSLHALLLGFNGAAVQDDLRGARRQIMPERLEWADDGQLPVRSATLWKIEEEAADGWALPFMGADKSIVTRSQYYDAVENGVKPVRFQPYTRTKTMAHALKVMAFGALLQVVSKYEKARRFMMEHPGLTTMNTFTAVEEQQFSQSMRQYYWKTMIQDEGPTEQQMREASFTYRFYGYGYVRGDPKEQPPRKKLLVTCTGPDLGYIGTSGCVLSSALVFLKEKEKLPSRGGVYTTATAFRNSRILNTLEEFGIKFEIEFPAKL